MREIVVDRLEEGGAVTLSFRFKSIGQLIDPDDPSPLPDTELTELAEETITGYLDEYRVKTPVSLVIDLPEGDIPSNGTMLIPDAIHRHFSFHVRDVEHDLVISRREGMYSLAIATGNALIAILFVYLAMSTEIPIESFPIVLFAGFITILNWVTIWDTYEHFVYDYRNIWRKKLIYQKLSGIPISVREF
jgi:hypothetical protein